MKIKNHLLLRIFMAIALGILLGQWIPEPFLRFFVTFNSLFNQFLEFCIPLIILAFIVPSIGKLGNAAGKMVAITALLAYTSTLLAGFSSYVVSMWAFPSLLENQSLEKITQTKEVLPYFSIQIPPILDVISALVLAFVLGIGVSKISKSTLLKGSEEFEKIITQVITYVLIPFLPIYIFGIFLVMTYQGEVGVMMRVFAKIIGVIFILHIVFLLFQYFLAGFISKKNPFKALRTMLPAYVTALGTQSSAATIPVTLAQAEKMGVSEAVAKLTIPLCATIHLSGSMLKIVACAIALMLVQGMPIQTEVFIGFIAMLGIAMVAAPGVPGGAIMAAVGIIGTMLGFDEKNQALMISLYIAMDSFGTAANVTGDGAIALIVNRWFSKREIQWKEKNFKG